MNVPSVYEQSNPKTHTVYVSGLPDDVTEKAVLEVFVAFGDILEIQLPKEKVQEGRKQPGDQKLRGFAFITYTSSLDAQDAIDNYDLNVFPGHPGRVLKCNLAQPRKNKLENGRSNNRAVWSTEEWLSAHGTDAPVNLDHVADDAAQEQA